MFLMKTFLLYALYAPLMSNYRIPYESCKQITCYGVDEHNEEAECVKKQSCKAVVTQQYGPNTSQFNVYLTNTNATRPLWVAVGHSNDNEMGNDVVIECYSQPINNVAMAHSYNLPYAKQNAILSDFETFGVAKKVVVNSGGVVRCGWTRNTRSGLRGRYAVEISLDHHEHVLIAYGELDLRHSKKMKHVSVLHNHPKRWPRSPTTQQDSINATTTVKNHTKSVEANAAKEMNSTANELRTVASVMALHLLAESTKTGTGQRFQNSSEVMGTDDDDRDYSGSTHDAENLNFIAENEKQSHSSGVGGYIIVAFVLFVAVIIAVGGYVASRRFESHIQLEGEDVESHRPTSPRVNTSGTSHRTNWSSPLGMKPPDHISYKQKVIIPTQNRASTPKVKSTRSKQYHVTKKFNKNFR